LNGTTLTLTANGAGNDITANLVDNNPDALDIQQGTNNYINIDTSDSQAVIAFGNTGTNPNYNFLGSGITTLSGDLIVNGNDLSSATAGTFNLLATASTTGLNLATSATSLSIGAGSGTTTVNNDLTVALDLAVNGGDITGDDATLNINPNGGSAGTLALGTGDAFTATGNVTLFDANTDVLTLDTANATDNAVVDGSILRFRGRHDSDPTGGLTQATLDAEIFHNMLTAGASPTSSLDFSVSGTTRLSIGSAGTTTSTAHFTMAANQNLSLASGTGTYTQTFTDTTATAMAITANNLTSGKALNITSSANSFTGDLGSISLTGTTGVTGSALNLASSGIGADNKTLRVAQTGNTSGTDYAGYFTNTGAATTNVGLYATASGGTNNYAAIFESGNVGIGTATPQALLHVAGNSVILGNDDGTATTISGQAASGTDQDGDDLIFQASNGTGTGGSGDIKFQTATGGQSVDIDDSTDCGGESCGTSSAGTGTSTLTALSWSHRVADKPNRMLLVGVITGGGGTTPTVSSVQYGSQTMTQVSTDVSGTSVRATLFYLANPDVGTNTITVVTSATTNIAGTALSYSGVDSTLGNNATGDQAATTSYTTGHPVVTSEAGEVVVDIAGMSSTSANWTVGADQSGFFGTSGQDSNANSANMSSQSGASSVPMTWTANSSVDWASVAVALQPFGGGSSAVANTMTDRLVIQSDGSVGINSSSPTGYFDVNNGALMVLDNSGSYVGIGTTAPTEKLHLAGGNLLIDEIADTGATTASWLKSSPTTPGTLASGGTTGITAVRTAAVYNGKIYVGTNKTNEAEIYRYDGGVTWTRINSAAGTVVSNIGTQSSIDEIKSMAVFNGYLYFGVSETGGAAVYRYDGNSGANTFTKVSQSTSGTIAASGTSGIDGIEVMGVWNGNLIIGTTESNAAEVYRYDGGTTWTKISQSTAGTIASGGTANINDVSALAIYNNSLYIGTGGTGADGAELYRYDGGTTWTRLNTGVGQFVSTTAIGHATSLATYNGALFIGTEKSNASEVYRYDNGTGFQLVSSFSSTNEVESLNVYNSRLYAGLSRSNSAETQRYDGGTSWTLITLGSGQYITGGNTGLDTAGPAAVLNGEYYQFPGDSTNGTEAFKYRDFEGQSYALKFRAASDNAGSAGDDSTTFPNTASLYFAAEQQSVNNGNISVGGTFVATHGLTTNAGAYDIAEDYPTRDDSLVAGEVVIVDPSETGFVKKSAGEYERGVVGIYSENPALRLSQTDKTFDGGKMVPVALAGRVPVKVAPNSEPIQPGDYLTTSPESGKAMKATKFGPMVGKALEAWTPESGKDKVLVFVTLDDADPTGMLANLVVDENGNLDVPELSSGKILVDAGIGLDGTITNGSLVYEAKISEDGTESLAIDVAASLRSIDQKIADLEDKEASNSSQIAQLADRVNSQSGVLSEAVATTSSALSSLRSQIDDLFASMSGT
jgi:hypothetical protein